MENYNKLLSAKVNSSIYFNTNKINNKRFIINRMLYTKDHINNVGYKKVITMTANKRPNYTKIVVDNLKKCIGFEEYLLLPVIEPKHPEIYDIFKDIQNCKILINDKEPGCSINTFKALRRGFDISEFVIHIEDDTVPGIDTLKYFEWIYKTYKNDNSVFTASSYNNISNIEHKDYFTCNRKKWFTPWLWATWIDRFNEMIEKWGADSWDTVFNKKIRKDRYEIYPNLSRCQNIGENDGTFSTPKQWKDGQYNKIWINGIENFDYNLFHNSEFKEMR